MVAKLGSGARFQALKNKLAGQKGVTNPGALTAWIGRKKYGKRKFQKLAKAGRTKLQMADKKRRMYS